MKKLITLVSLILTLNTSALTLNEARSKGWVEELPSGFLKATNTNAEVLAKEINSKRKKAYLKISKKTNASLEAIGAQAHKKIKAKMKK